jgi:serine/threonine-protein phosphatase 4 regulatory subunit 1
LQDPTSKIVRGTAF